MSTGSVRSPFAPIGSNLPDFDNYFCRDCRHIVHVRYIRAYNRNATPIKWTYSDPSARINVAHTSTVTGH